MEDQVLVAVGWQPAPLWVKFALDSFFKMRAVLLRHLFIPRFKAIALPEVGKDGRVYREFYGFEPWYMSQSLWSRIKTWVETGGRLSVGGRFGETGYRPEEVGPPELIKLSKDEVLVQADAMKEYVEHSGSSGGCPFLFGGQLDWKRT